MENLSTLTKEQLLELQNEIAAEIGRRCASEFEIMELAYNTYKGSGKCWIATVDPATKKILRFLDPESKVPRDNYSGHKVFRVPLVDGTTYLMCQSGSKSTDSRQYFTVQARKLEKM